MNSRKEQQVMAVEEVSGCWRGNKNDLLHCRAVKVLEQESADPAFSFSTNWCWDGGQAFACLRPQFPVGSSGKVGLQDSKGSICSKCLIYGYVLALVFRAINSRFIFSYLTFLTGPKENSPWLYS